jgi:glycosyltransferase involved in cell wall biosynthesis
MKKVLMIAYQFPPTGGSGVQRTVKFAKYLPGFGWEPVVLTREAGRMKLRDESLMREIPDGLEVIRTPPVDLTELPGPLSKVGKFVAWKLLIPDGEILWMRRALGIAARRLGKGDIDCIYTTSYPFSDHLLGLEAKRRFPGLPWVADFRDEWTNNPYYLDKPCHAWRRKREREMEKSVLAGAERLIANTPIMKRNFVEANPGINLDKRMTVIPNGFDPDDFNGYRSSMPRNDRFTVTYTGSLYGRRKPDSFLKAVGNLVRLGTIHPDTIRIRFIGNIKRKPILGAIAKNGLRDIVEIIPYMEHAECIENMQKSDVLLLLEGGKGSEAFYTGKLFEYIQARRPILALVPADGAAAELIRETMTGIVCGWEDVKCIEKGLSDLYGRWAGGRLEIEPDEREIMKYDRSVLTGMLASVFDDLTGPGRIQTDSGFGG